MVRKSIGLQYVDARAAARALGANIHFDENRFFLPLLVTDLDGGAVSGGATARLPIWCAPMDCPKQIDSF